MVTIGLERYFCGTTHRGRVAARVSGLGSSCPLVKTWLADSHRYRQFGNAVCVPVAQWIANRIMEAPND